MEQQLAEARIAAIQAKPVSNNHAELCAGGDVTHSIDLLEEAKLLGANIACFPELYPSVGEKELCKAAKNLDIWVVAGLLEYGTKNEQYNTATIISGEGEVLLRQRKLFPTERELARGVVAGSSAKVIESPFGRLGVAICSDLAFNHLVIDSLSEQNVDILFNPAWWFALAEGFPASVMGRHFEYGIPIIGVDIAKTAIPDDDEGRWEFDAAGGFSTVAVPPTISSVDELAKWFRTKQSGPNSTDDIFHVYGEDEQVEVHRIDVNNVRSFPGYFFREKP